MKCCISFVANFVLVRETKNEWKHIMFSLIFGNAMLNYVVELQIDNKGRVKETRLSSL